MKISVILTNGEERYVSKDELQFLLAANKVICFERSDGCAFVGYDKMRMIGAPYLENDRRIDDSLLAS